MADDDTDLSGFEEFSSTAGKGRGTGSGKSGIAKRGRRWPWFLGGLVVGVTGAIWGPELTAPYLPAFARPGFVEVRGPVLGKRVEGERVLLTVDGERGALLATFRQRVPEIDLLVEEGDTVVLGVDRYVPLVEEPALLGVRKGRPPSGEAAGSRRPAFRPTATDSPGGSPTGSTANPPADSSTALPADSPFVEPSSAGATPGGPR